MRDNENEEPEVVFADPSGIHIPRCFNVAFLTPIIPFSIAHWDKTHKKVVLGCPRQKVKMFRRKRGSSELCNPGEEGDVSDKRPRLKHVKFPGKIRLLLGVAVVQLLDGTIVGQRCAPYDCTGKNICSEKDMHKHEQEEVHRVQQLKGEEAG